MTAEQKEQFSESSFEESTRKFINEGIVKNIYTGVSTLSVSTNAHVDEVKAKINEFVKGLSK
jgi:hypothetical protein